MFIFPTGHSKGDLRRAEDHFRSVHDRATKGQAAKKKYLFGSLVGLVSRILHILYCGMFIEYFTFHPLFSLFQP